MHKNSDMLGAILKTAREKAGITVEALAENIGITERYLYRIENEGKKPSYEVLYKLIRELSIPPDSIFYPENRPTILRWKIFSVCFLFAMSAPCKLLRQPQKLLLIRFQRNKSHKLRAWTACFVQNFKCHMIFWIFIRLIIINLPPTFSCIGGKFLK